MMRIKEKTREQLLKEINQLRNKIAKQTSTQGEKNLLKQQKISDKILETSSALIIGLDKNHLIRIFNSGAENITGYKKKDVIGKDWFDIFFPDEMLDEMNKVWENVWGVTSHSYVNLILSKTGEEKVISWQSTGIYEGRNDKNHLLISMGEDITKRKQAEAELMNSENNLHNLIENLMDGVAIADENSKHIYVNSRFSEITGYSKNELLNMTGWDFTRQEDRAKLKQKMKDRMAGKQVDTHYERVLLKKDGTEVPVEMSTTVTNWQGQQRPMAIIHDITEQKNTKEKLEKYHNHLEEIVKQRTADIENQSKRLEESQQALTFLLEDVNDARKELEKANQQLIAANIDMESFTYSVSHDLRAPLRAILGFSKKFTDSYGKLIDKEGKRLLNVINDNTKKMGMLIDDLLDFSRMGRAGMHKVKVDIKGLVHETWNDQKNQFNNRKIELTIKELPMVNGDRNMLRQVLYNLLSNAAKFSKNKKISKIEVGFEEGSSETIYYVKDNGVGFDMKYKDKLFQVFQRLHSDREFMGTGVGLAIVHKVINRHGGKVWARSTINRGATIYFSLPK